MNLDIYLIWALSNSDPEAPWIVDAWDEFSIDGNEPGWSAAIKKAEEENDAIRIVKTTLNHEQIVALFQPTALNNTGLQENDR